MKILLYGEYWPGTHVECISKVLQEKSIDFKIFDFYSILYKSYGNRLINKISRTILFSKREQVINAQLEKEIETFKPDVLLISKGVNIYPETLLKFKKSSILIINWNPDDFFNIKNSSVHLRNSFNLYDIVFSARMHLFDEYKESGIKNPHYLEWYYIPWLHKKITEIVKPESKVTFIGTYSKRREDIIRSISKNFPIEIWGAGWQFSTVKFSKNISLQNKVLSQAEFPAIISNSLVNLNILTVENRDLTNLKIFELTASYGLLLSEYNSVSNTILEGNKQCYYYNANEPDNLNHQLDRIFNQLPSKELMATCDAGYNVMQTANHSIFDRVDTILNTIN